MSWASAPDPVAGIGWFKWLTRDLVKVECGIVDPGRGGRGLIDWKLSELKDAIRRGLADRS